MEIHWIGPCVLIYTAGFYDDSELGESRIEKAKLAVWQADLAVIIFDAAKPVPEKFELEKQWYDLLQKNNTPVIFAVSKTDLAAETVNLANLTDKIRR